MGADPTITDFFLASLAARGIKVRAKTEDGRYLIVAGSEEILVDLKSLKQRFGKDRDPSVIDGFLDVIMAERAIPPWPEAGARLRFLAEAAREDFGDALRDQITIGLYRVVVCLDPGGRPAWVRKPILERWQVGEAHVKVAAAESMDRLLDESPFKVETVHGCRLGVFECDPAFRASLIFGTEFQSKVSEKLGWPVFVLIPSRETLFVIAQRDQAFLGEFRAFVTKDFAGSEHPLTPHIIRIGDDGIRAVGAFPLR